MRSEGDRRRGNRAQSAPIAVVLLIGLAILGATAIVAIGGTAIDGTEGQSEIARAEQSMALFDSQSAQVALGESESQSVSFGYVNGNYRVNDTAGEISIVQIDCDDNETNDDGDDVPGGDDDAILASTDLGTVVYERNGVTVGYQGGGVWKERDGGSTMVSPPEFHFRGQTLTLPIIQTNGTGSVGGSTTANIEESVRAKRVFPNASDSFDATRCGDSRRFLNPVTKGRVIVRIESRFAEAWGDYFAERTAGEVTYPDEDVVIVELVALGNIGQFQMPGEDGSITVPGAADGHNTPEFTFRVRPDDTDSADFSNLQWSFFVSEGSQRLEIYLKKGSGGNKCPNTDIEADLDVYYSDDGGDTYEAWHVDDAYAAECADLNGDGDEEIYMDVELVDDEDGNGNYSEVDSDDPELEATDSAGMNNLLHFNIKGTDTPVDPIDVSGHGVYWEAETYNINSNERETVDRLINHYFAELPEDFELTVDDQNSDTINEGASSGYLETTGDGSYVTYLHVTRNEIEVELN